MSELKITSFTPNFFLLIWVYLVISLLTVLVGLSNSRIVLSKPPLEVLRKVV